MNSRGLTLVELIVVSTILVILTGLVYGVFRYQSQAFARQTAQNVTQNDLRTWLGRIAQDIRRAGYDPYAVNDPAVTPPVFGLQEMLSSTLRFTLDDDENGTLDSGAAENRGFRLNGSDLELWQGGSTWRPVLFGVTALSIEYLDQTGSPVSNRRDIRAVAVTVSAQSETGGAPGSPAPVLTQTVTADLRNPVY